MVIDIVGSTLSLSAENEADKHYLSYIDNQLSSNKINYEVERQWDIRRIDIPLSLKSI
jgi:hypothetical protein